MVREIGKYKIGEIIGEGAFGKVKYGVNKETGERVAIKIISKAKLAKQNMEKQTKKEILIMKRINHPNIVKLIDVYQTKTKLYLVMELVTGGELFEKIAQEGKLSEDQSRRYFQQLIDAVEYMHNIGVCHRDLKPENMLIDEDDCVHISDFGLSAVIFQDSTPPPPMTASPNQVGTALSEHVVDTVQSDNPNAGSGTSPDSGAGTVASTMSSVSPSKSKTPSSSPSPSPPLSSSPVSISPASGSPPSSFSSSALTPTQRGVRLHAPCGTPHYSAPELLQPAHILLTQGYLGPPVDVWSAGVILFVMNAGYFPFHGKTTEILYKKIRSASYKCPIWFSAPLQDLLSKIFVVDPTKRITVGGIKKHPWFLVNYKQVSSPPLPDLRDLDPEAHEAYFREMEISNPQEEALSDDEHYSPPRANAFALINMSGAFSLSKMVAKNYLESITPQQLSEKNTTATTGSSEEPSGPTSQRFSPRPETTTSTSTSTSARANVRRNTNFSSEAPPDVIMKRLIEILTRLPLAMKVHRRLFKIDIIGRTGSGLLCCTLQIYRLAPDLHMVDMRKCKGDDHEFWRLYRSIYKQCKSLLKKN